MQGQSVIVMILLAFSGSLLVGSDFRLQVAAVLSFAPHRQAALHRRQAAGREQRRLAS